MASPDFARAIDIVLYREGGYVDNPDDPGGETKYGISKKSYPNVDIANLTIEKAKDIYFNDYWVPMRCAELPSRLRVICLDMAVLQGIGTAVKVLQKAIRSAGHTISIDGVIGEETLKYAPYVEPDRLRAFRVLQLAQNAGNNITFWYGWYKRAIEL